MRLATSRKCRRSSRGASPCHPAACDAALRHLIRGSEGDHAQAAALFKEAAEAYVYGYPLVYDLQEVAEFVEGGGSLPIQAPYNTFAYARRLLGPETKFVSPNNDTLYVIAMLDVRQGPVVLHVPDTHDRYYVLQFVDAWSNNFAYIGRRATGTAEAEFLLTDSAYDGPVPDGMTVVRAPTGVFTIVGRIQVDGEADLAAVHALQDQFTLTPLPAGTDGASPAQVAGVPEPDPQVHDDLRWWEQFRVALAAFPPPAADAPFVVLAERLGLTAAQSPNVDPDPPLAELLVAGQQASQAKIEELAGSGDRTPGLHTADDGSVTIFMQSDSPGPDNESNWLPTPERRFRPILRMYQPQKAILDGTYVLPAVRKVD